MDKISISEFLAKYARFIIIVAAILAVLIGLYIKKQNSSPDTSSTNPSVSQEIDPSSCKIENTKVVYRTTKGDICEVGMKNGTTTVLAGSCENSAMYQIGDDVVTTNCGK